MNRQQRRAAERAHRKAMTRRPPGSADPVEAMQLASALDESAETTPAEITPAILSFCAEIDLTQTPSYVSVRPVPGAFPRDCYFNVEDEVKTNGGSIQYGWIIWELPHVFLNAEFHAVLVRDGGMVDITPKDEQRILFLPDSNRQWERRVVSAVRKAMCPEAVGYLDLVGENDRLRLKYERFPAVKGTDPIDLDAMTPQDQRRSIDLGVRGMRMYKEMIALSRRKSRVA